jgi:hypothetical protein
LFCQYHNEIALHFRQPQDQKWHQEAPTSSYCRAVMNR